MTLPFVLPAPASFSSSPVWNGRKFVYDGIEDSVLEYSENFAGWSDDLTAMHEVAAGDRHPVDVASRADALRQVMAAMPSGEGVVMEIGCSSGFFIRNLAEAFPRACVIGADVVKQPLHNLSRLMPGIPLIRFDLLKNPLPGRCIDTLIMLNVLEHIEDDGLALRNAFNLLKPGGTLVIEVPAGQYLYDSYDAQLHHFRRYSATELKAKLTAVGFQVNRTSHLGFLLFPGFAAVKLINKIRGDAKTVVQTQAATTSNSLVVSLVMRLENKLQKFCSFPFGIRVLMTAKRVD